MMSHHDIWVEKTFAAECSDETLTNMVRSLTRFLDGLADGRIDPVADEIPEGAAAHAAFRLDILRWEQTYRMVPQAR